MDPRTQLCPADPGVICQNSEDFLVKTVDHF
jgi:hypothetical protein